MEFCRPAAILRAGVVCLTAGDIRGEVSELVDERDLGSRGDCSP